jgi:hypothetical protein
MCLGMYLIWTELLTSVPVRTDTSYDQAEPTSARAGDVNVRCVPFAASSCLLLTGKLLNKT